MTLQQKILVILLLWEVDKNALLTYTPTLQSPVVTYARVKITELTIQQLALVMVYQWYTVELFYCEHHWDLVLIKEVSSFQ